MKSERRVDRRNRSFARILISVEGRFGYIADVSEGGFKGLFPEPFGLEIGSILPICVSFEEMGLGFFSLKASVRWLRLAGGALEVGFELFHADDAALSSFERIRDYYSRSIQC
jgi:hypothetical protein